jgi:hypothetical protein
MKLYSDEKVMPDGRECPFLRDLKAYVTEAPKQVIAGEASKTKD